MTNYARGEKERITISIHIPRVGDDEENAPGTFSQTIFQSTSPVWGMTPVPDISVTAIHHFNPHPPCGG